MSYKPQSASTLFLIPIEIRRDIYANLLGNGHIHITLLSSKAGFRLTRCSDPDLGAEHVGDKRRPAGDDPDNRIWARRLSSTWGPHWQCEESSLAKEEETKDKDDAVIPSSYFEILDVMREQVCFHITDLDTIGTLFQYLSASPATSGSLGFEGLVAPHIQKLEVALSLPLAFFEYFDDQPSAPGRELAPLFQEQARIWTEMPQGIDKLLPSLRKLSIWLDHTQRPYWSVLHERAVLRPFEQLGNLSRLDLSFDLPMLRSGVGGATHLFLEEEDTGGCHFNNPSPTPIYIRRRLRQRQRVVNAGAGIGRAPTIRWCPDFPLGLKFSVNDGLSVAEMALRERAMERQGINVEQELVMSIFPDLYIPALLGMIFGRPDPLKDHGHLCLE
ncbi:hypothetical protein PG997_010933 [Apiospora hydei]|uniref:DUF7730 domain-containing protein n=1 Tax=Apiospora hydei TaxID=1337664 RepID=A0ABR1VKH0_9PEZI